MFVRAHTTLKMSVLLLTPTENCVDPRQCASTLTSQPAASAVTAATRTCATTAIPVPTSLPTAPSNRPATPGRSPSLATKARSKVQQLRRHQKPVLSSPIDLVLCNCPEVIDGVSTHSPGVSEFSSDHYIIDFWIRVKFHRANPARRKVYNFKRRSFTDLRSSIEHIPFDIAFSENIDEYWLAWKDLFLTPVSECIPVRIVKDTNSPPWIDSEACHCLRKKYTALRKYRHKKTATNKFKLRSLSQEVKYVIRAKHRDYLKKIESSFKDNPKLFWNYHKAILHS